MSKAFRLGTRGSLLARTQSIWVADQIKSEIPIELCIVRTEGDDLSLSLTHPLTPGAFVNALRNSLLNGEVDFIVHSYKDLPSHPHPKIEIAAIPQREDHRDILLTHMGQKFSDLKFGDVVGTSSPRRIAAVKYLNPELLTYPIRGNIDSRIRKVREGEYAAIILAAAGLSRLGMSGEISEYFDIDRILPAPAQGALAVECRRDDLQMVSLLRGVDDQNSRITTTAERALLQGLNAGCDLAVGANAVIESETLTLISEIADPQTGQRERVTLTGDLSEAWDLGIKAAQILKSSSVGSRILGSP